MRNRSLAATPDRPARAWGLGGWGIGSTATTGQTRACVGVGACQGGQLCGAQRTWSPCDCGSGNDGGTDAQSDVSIEGEGGGQSDASSEVEASVPAPCEKDGKCPTMAMVEIQWPDGKGSYFIDAYEVKGREYGVFEEVVQGGYVPPVTDKDCVDNTTHLREATCVHYWGSVTDEQIAEAGAYCVGYCSAQAYCEWVGKRLCRMGGVRDDAGVAGIGDDEWANACSNGGASPNSSDLPMEQCDKFDPPCSDAVSGLYGMEWGFAEWVEYVDTTGGTLSYGTSMIHAHLGSESPSKTAVCNDFSQWGRVKPSYQTAFRCCR